MSRGRRGARLEPSRDDRELDAGKRHSRERDPGDPDDPAPRVLGVRFGVNPNSSSLGVDVTYLLFGGAAALATGLLVSLWLRARASRLAGSPGLPEVAPAGPGVVGSDENGRTASASASGRHGAGAGPQDDDS